MEFPHLINSACFRIYIVEYYWKKKFGKLRHFITALDLLKKEKNEIVYFVQIGANTKVGYPLELFVKDAHWQNLLIEPDSENFKQLVLNYQDQKNMKFENCAVSAADETKEFFFVEDQGDAPEWATQLNSFKKDGLEWLQKQYPKVLIGSTHIECKTLENILRKHQIPAEKLSLIQIDTEGYDHVILKSLDLLKMKPQIIIFEHRHLKDTDAQDCRRFLQNFNYHLFVDQHDTLAYNSEVQNAIFSKRYEL